MGRRGVAGAGLSAAKEAPVDAGVAPSGASLPLVAPAPATLPQLEILSGPDLTVATTASNSGKGEKPVGVRSPTVPYGPFHSAVRLLRES